MIPARPFRVAPTVHFGENAAVEAGAEAKRLGASNALVVTYKILMAAGVIQPAIDSLKSAGLKVEIFDGVPRKIP